MPDVVVTVPKNFRYAGWRGLKAWCAEGDCAGTEWTGEEWGFSTWGAEPNIVEGERVYVVCEDRVRGYAPLIEVLFNEQRRGQGYLEFVRGGGAVAVTIPEKITGFRGWRYRWWEREAELPFPDWQTTDVRKQPRGARAQQQSLWGRQE